MATVYITEFENLSGAMNGGVAQAAKQPPVAEQTVAIGSASVPSNAFNARTRLVRLHTDAVCSVVFGSSPTAASTSMRLAANSTEYFGVDANVPKVAVITNS